MQKHTAFEEDDYTHSHSSPWCFWEELHDYCMCLYISWTRTALVNVCQCATHQEQHIPAHLSAFTNKGYNVHTAVAASAIVDGGNLFWCSSAGSKCFRVMADTVLCGPKKKSCNMLIMASFWYGFEPTTPLPYEDVSRIYCNDKPHTFGNRGYMYFMSFSKSATDSLPARASP